MADYNGILNDDTAILVGSKTRYREAVLLDVLSVGNRDSNARKGISEVNELMSVGQREDPMNPIEIRRTAQSGMYSGIRKSKPMEGDLYLKNEMQVVRLPNKVDGIRQGDDSNFKFQDTPRKFPLDNSWVKNRSQFKRNK